MEIDPKYVAVILQRWQDATGIVPVIVGDGNGRYNEDKDSF